MKKRIYFLFVILNVACCSLLYAHSKIVYNDGIKIWTESFGDNTKKPILLISGAACQCVLWPDKFCKQLANMGFFVIRYDHRDIGYSSIVDYVKHPYNVMDLTKDALAVLNDYKILKAHIVGFSMGGEIAQFIGAYYPERALSIVLMATSTDMKPGFNAFEGKSTQGKLSPPKNEYIKWATRSVDPVTQSYNEKINDFVQKWKLLNKSAGAVSSL